MNSKKNISKFKNFYFWHFEEKGFYITYKLIKIKQKKSSTPQPVKYLKTSRYVIPLPSDEPLYNKSNKKNLTFSRITILSISLYNYYDSYFKQANGFFFTSFYTNYNPDSLPNVTKFDYNVWFDILRILNTIYRFITENSFFFFWLKSYFSITKFKFFSIIFFKKMFKIYINPNLPLKRKKGENFTPKQQGLSALLLWELLFKQLTLETINFNYHFTSSDLRIFKQCQINPYDETFFWPTRRLFLLGLSSYDGKNFSEKMPNKNIFFKKWNFSLPYTLVLRLIKNITTQYKYWKLIFLQLAKENKLIYEPTLSNNFNFDLIDQSKFRKKLLGDLLKISNPYLFNFINKKLLTDSKIKFTITPLPMYFIGTKFTFFKKNYLFFNKQNLNLLNFPIIKEFLLSFPFFSNKEIFFFPIITASVFYSHQNYSQIYNFLESKSRNTTISYKNITSFDVVNYLKISKLNSAGEENILPVPEFLKEFFFLLTQKNISEQDIYTICIDWFLPTLIKITTWFFNNETVQNFFNPLYIYKKYFLLKCRYNLNSTTFAYKIFWNMLNWFSPQNWLLWELETFNSILINFDTLPFFNQKLKPITTTTKIDNFNFFKKKLKNWILKNSKNNSIFFEFFYKIFYFYKLSFDNLLLVMLFRQIKFIKYLKIKIKNNIKKRINLFLKPNKLFKKLKNSELSSFYNDSDENFDVKSYINLTTVATQNITLATKYRLLANIFLKKTLFTSWRERYKTYFIVNTMYKILWTVHSNKYYLISNRINYFSNYLWANDESNFAFIYKKKFNFTTELYAKDYFEYLKIFYITKYFFSTFQTILKLWLR